MFSISALALMVCWSSVSVSEARPDGCDSQALTLQDEQPPHGSEADQEPKHRRYEPPANDEGRGTRRWNKSRHERFRDSRSGPELSLSPDMIETAMGVLRDKLPHYYEEMTKLREEDITKFERAMRTLLPVVMEYLEVRDRDQKLADSIIEEFKIEHQLRELSREYKAAEGSTEQQAACEEQIRKLVRQQFELRLVWQEARLKEFAERIERQRQDLERERQNLEQRRQNSTSRLRAVLKKSSQGRSVAGFIPGDHAMEDLVNPVVRREEAVLKDRGRSSQRHNRLRIGRPTTMTAHHHPFTTLNRVPDRIRQPKPPPPDSEEETEE